MRFEWDIYKAIANVAKHGIGFEQAVTVFDDVYPLISEVSSRVTTDEKRYQIIGEVDPSCRMGNQRILTVVYTVREAGESYRLISARPSRRAERRVYEIQKKFRESAI